MISYSTHYKGLYMNSICTLNKTSNKYLLFCEDTWEPFALNLAYNHARTHKSDRGEKERRN